VPESLCLTGLTVVLTSSWGVQSYLLGPQATLLSNSSSRHTSSAGIAVSTCVDVNSSANQTRLQQQQSVLSHRSAAPQIRSTIFALYKFVCMYVCMQAPFQSWRHTALGHYRPVLCRQSAHGPRVIQILQPQASNKSFKARLLRLNSQQHVAAIVAMGFTCRLQNTSFTLTDDWVKV